MKHGCTADTEDTNMSEQNTESAVSSASAPPSGERTAWLVEGAGPCWLGVSRVGKVFAWVTHVDWALQLETEDQANALRDAVRELRPDLFPDCYPMPRGTEHLWMAPRTGEQK